MNKMLFEGGFINMAVMSNNAKSLLSYKLRQIPVSSFDAIGCRLLLC